MTLINNDLDNIVYFGLLDNITNALQLITILKYNLIRLNLQLLNLHTVSHRRCIQKCLQNNLTDGKSQYN